MSLEGLDEPPGEPATRVAYYRQRHTVAEEHASALTRTFSRETWKSGPATLAQIKTSPSMPSAQRLESLMAKMRAFASVRLVVM
ncbi:hypothetical protein [Pseudofrankia sp. BMG5.36]|uniref:hypothetical protein n=1 Tax=Pseudofrankia sp. BMG5.36 TaxID=1834512 RepID=UPI0008DAFE6D|nr:hypothetical protein [Pseudofrankia sp. BMG5.36]OHV69564.1 hypothetical protein BCD48_34735 [Pseudofrankia sp. BMG5.36]